MISKLVPSSTTAKNRSDRRPERPSARTPRAASLNRNATARHALTAGRAQTLLTPAFAAAIAVTCLLPAGCTPGTRRDLRPPQLETADRITLEGGHLALRLTTTGAWTDVDDAIKDAALQCAIAVTDTRATTQARLSADLLRGSVIEHTAAKEPPPPAPFQDAAPDDHTLYYELYTLRGVTGWARVERLDPDTPADAPGPLRLSCQVGLGEDLTREDCLLRTTQSVLRNYADD